MSKYWQPCPRCGSKRVQVQGKLFWFLMLLCLGGILTLIGVFIIPLLFIGIPMAIISPVGFILPTYNTCKDCKKSWRPNKVKEKASV